MSIKKSDVEAVAYLAKLNLAEDTAESILQDMSNILGFVDQLQTADTTNIEPLANPLDATQRLRPDTVTENDQREALQSVAPATENGLYLVPKVIE